MLTFIRSRITVGNAAITIVVLLAMTGGAYAAKRYVITSLQQISPKVRAQLKGAAGHAGVAGPRGEVGPKGDTGPKGETGAKGDTGAKGETGAVGQQGVQGIEGKAGESVTVAGFSGSKGTCTEGGSEFSNKTGKGLACNGAKGATGPEGICSTASCVLPAGATLKGEWAVRENNAAGFAGLVTTGSFDIPLKSGPTAHVIPPGVPATGKGDLTSGSAVVKNVSASSGEFSQGSVVTGSGIPAETIVEKVISSEEFELSANATSTATGVAISTSLPAGCSGNSQSPGASSGNLCVFMEEEQDLVWSAAAPFFDPHVEHATAFGFMLKMLSKEPGIASAAGTWAVTG